MTCTAQGGQKRGAHFGSSAQLCEGALARGRSRLCAWERMYGGSSHCDTVSHVTEHFNMILLTLSYYKYMMLNIESNTRYMRSRRIQVSAGDSHSA